MLQARLWYIIYNEIKDGKTYKIDVKNMIVDLGTQKDKLCSWKKQWLVWEDTPESLYLDFWGTEKYDTIKVKLTSMEAFSREATKSLKDYNHFTSAKWTALRYQRKWLKKKSIWAKKDYLQKLLGKITQILKDLDEAAKEGLQRDVPENRRAKDVDFAHVQRMGIGHLLVRIAMQTHCYTEMLWQSCHYAQEILTTELDLDIFGASFVDAGDKSPENIVKANAEKCATLTILTRKAALQRAAMTRTRVKRFDGSAGGHATALAEAFTHVLDGSKRSQFMAGAGLTFETFRSRTQCFEPGTGVRESIRQIQSRNQPPHFTNGALLGKISKFRIAFELSQACLLFLRTTWFSKICSCGIHCGKRSDIWDEPQFDFTIKIGNFEHRPAQWARNQSDNCWGLDSHNWNVLTRPLRRLALLLVEVSLGATVLRAQCDESGVITNMIFLEREADDLSRVVRSSEYVLENVRKAAYGSRLYRDAVEFCATTIVPLAPDDAQMKELLARFYWKVVVP